MQYIKTNTATRVTVGPFFDRTDGITPEVAITVTSCKLTFVVDDAGVPTLILDVAPTASGGANDMVHITGDDAGYYDLELAAANVNYVGRANLAITDAAVHCPVFHEYTILPAQVYDSLFAGTDNLDVNVEDWGNTAVPTTEAGGPFVIRRNTATGGAAGTITLDLSASSVTDFYAGGMCEIIGGTGIGQSRLGAAYNGTTKVLTVDRNWATTPDNTSVFRIFAGSLASTLTETVAALEAGASLTALVGADRTYVKAVAVTAFSFPMYTTAGVAATGATVTFQISKDGGAFATVAGAVAEISGGWYKVDLTGTELNADEVAIKATASGCQQTDVKIRTQS